MARLDIHRRSDGPGYLMDCQSDMLAHLSTRLVVPLLPIDFAPNLGARLNPSFEIEGEELIMMTHFTGSVPKSALGEVVGSLVEEHSAIMNAFDMLLTGY